MNDTLLTKICSIYWPITFIIGISLNTVLYWLIFTKTTKVFKSMKYFLVPSNTAQTFITFIGFFFQGRLIYNSQSLATLGQGWCRSFGPVACLYSYNLILVVLSVVIMVNLHTLYYRMISIYHQDKSAVARRSGVFAIHYLFSICSLIMSHIRSGDMSSASMASVYNETINEHPGYDFEAFAPFGGYRDVHSVWNKIMTYSYATMAFYAPIFGFYCRHRTLKILDLRINSLSEKTIAQFKSVVHGLTLQVLLPLFNYVPAAVFNTYNQGHTNDPFVFAQYTLTIFFTIPAIFDPILNIYFIIPYRNAIKRLVKFKIVIQSTSAPTSVAKQSSIIVTKSTKVV